ncbi:MerR family transcriptional regulator [Saccharibacillus sp. O23]|uniref:MerR family transcriptional regulator n=1 Tax=Saccharibacillus sp. O23 TaxID=2009338 RepID=UPI000B4E01BB|nr:MerR family transcriptional regulator [Saccharibacillus sp. O23]OWR27804.1 MerR family transcriptional regulator [Saccharibacillus sp. O23]
MAEQAYRWTEQAAASETENAQQEAYTIKQTSELTGLPEDTIRYYEKIGLLPRAKRRANTHRVYGQEDVQTMKLILCLKKTGMPLEEMKPYLEMSQTGDLAETPEAFERIREYRATVLEQIESLRTIVDFIDLKLAQGTLLNRQDCDADPQEGPGLPAKRDSRFR